MNYTITPTSTNMGFLNNPISNKQREDKLTKWLSDHEGKFFWSTKIFEKLNFKIEGV